MELKMVFLVILAVVSVIYLISLFFKFGLFQMILKGCLLPLILAVYIFGAKIILLPVVLALILGWIGDIFLLKIGNVSFFRIGLASFLAGHICYILAMFNYTQPFNITALACGIAVAVVLAFFIFKIVRPNAEMKIPVIFYEMVIFVMAVFAVQLFLAQGGYFGAFVLAGSLCFVVSDGMLAFDTFRKKTKYGFFFVMVTYILAQLFIILGFCYAG
jgi:uncharacterized membrane protein YhhN